MRTGIYIMEGETFPLSETMDDHVYTKARALLVADPEIGKKKLADALGVHVPMGRRLKERYRGEIIGHRTDPEYQRFLAVKTEHPDWGYQRVAAAMQIPVERAKLCLARYAGATAAKTPVASTPSPNVPAEGSSFQDSVHDGERNLSYKGDRIATLADFLVFAQVDTKTWEVERHVINKWEVGARGPGGEILTSPLFQIKVWLRRKVVENTIIDLMRGLLEEFRKEAPVRPAIARTTAARQGILEMSLMDLHLGKMAWAPETGRHYDADTAEEMFWTALEDLLAKASGCKPEKIAFIAGNDFLHTDTCSHTTQAGTGQDENLVWREAFVRGRVLLVRAIERLREIAPVHVACISGNHDYSKMYYLGEVLSARFGGTKDVTVDNSPPQRKYIHYGENLIGFTHGDKERTSLPLLMATERPQEWARSRHREWHVGHWHCKRHKMFLPIEDSQGVLVRIVPSLSAPDAWHASMGYSGKLAAEAYFWDPKDGCVATFTHSPA